MALTWPSGPVRHTQPPGVLRGVLGEEPPRAGKPLPWMRRGSSVTPAQVAGIRLCKLLDTEKAELQSH